MATQVRKIEIKVTQTGGSDVRRFARELALLNRTAKGVAVSFSKLKGVFGSFLAAVGISQVAKAADEFQLLEDRIKVFTGSSEQAAMTFEQLRDIAKQTRTSISNLAQTYNRVALSTNELGLTNNELLATVTALQNSFRLSGATIAEASAVAIQLSQGLSSGQLRGQELRSVLEQNAVFANILSKELGITRGQLIKFAESGKITSDVVLRALGKNFKDLSDRASKLGVTFGQAITIGFDDLLFRINRLNKEFNISGKFFKGIELTLKLLELFGNVLSDISKSDAFNKTLNFFGKWLNILAKFEPNIRNYVGLFKVVSSTVKQLETKETQQFLDEQKLGLATERLRQAQDSLSKLQTQFDKQQKAILETEKRWDSLSEKPVTLRKVTQVQIDEQIKKVSQFKSELENLKKEIAKRGGGFGAIEDAANTLATKKPLEKAIANIAQLNKLFLEGRITLQDFNREAQQDALNKINERFESGATSVINYYRNLLRVTAAISRLDQVSVGIRVGLFQVYDDASNLAKQFATFVNSTFSRLEDSIVEFVKKGKFEFRQLTNAILEDLGRIVLRAAITAPLANALGSSSLFSGEAAPTGSVSSRATPGGGFQAVQAKGGVWSNGNLMAFANGGIVNGPTMFPMRNGAGLMGEAGPEAIIPLTRRGGRLGVEGAPVNVNIINQGNNQIETRETKGSNGERNIDVIILGSVKKGLANGQFDKSLGQNFGLKRLGN